MLTGLPARVREEDQEMCVEAACNMAEIISLAAIN